MWLSRQSILRELETGNLTFDPEIDKGEQVGPSSIDLRLGTTFIYLDKQFEAHIEAGADIRYRVDGPWEPFQKKYTNRQDFPIGSDVELPRAKLILGYTLEHVYLPPWLAARVEGKSGPARRGLFVHLTAPTLQVGWDGQIQLEFLNMGPAPLLVRPGQYICQLILEQVSEPDQYEGQFQGQSSR